MKNSNKKQVICEHWETPVIDSESLWLYRLLYTHFNTYFFFYKDHDGINNPIYVLIIRCRDTFKVSDECESTNRIHKLLKHKPPHHIKWPKTFKVWNSPLAIEVCSSRAIPKEEYEQMEKYQYIILAQDETIEFVTLDIPKWEVHQNILLDDLVIQYLKKDSLD
jgi:hypothetical protein